MKRSNKDKIENLIEAFSQLTDSNLEEAKATILAAGKDPDAILKKSLGRLRSIKRNSNLRKESNDMGIEKLAFPSLILDKSINEITVSNTKLAEDLILGLQEAYCVLLRKEGIYGIAFKDLSISEEARSLKLGKLLKELAFTMIFQADHAIFKSMINNKNNYLDIKSISAICETGYYIENASCIPIDSESIDFAKELLQHIYDNDKIPIKIALDYFSKRSNLPLLRFEQSEFDLHKVVASALYSSESNLFTKTLYPYQQDGLKWLLYCSINKCGGILADDMGLGKTAQVIALIAGLLERDILANILIVVPSTLLENWRREFLFFAPSIIPFIHHGSQRSGSPKFLSSHKVVITAYSMVINDLYLFNKINWALVILDEASLIKNPDSERRLALAQLSSQTRIAMTGTPVENSLQDLWSIADYVRPGYLGNRTDFLTRYKFTDTHSATTDFSELRASISQIMLRRKKEDVLDSLPEKIDIHQAMEMQISEANLYEQKRQSILGLLEGSNKGTHLAAIIGLRMFTTHPRLMSPELLSKASISELTQESSKFRRMMEILEDIRESDEKVIIFTEFLSMIDVLENRLSAYFGIEILTIDGRIGTNDRQTNIDIFSKQIGFGIIILNPRTAGMGLNITAANHVIHYTRQWNPALEEQASARAYRNGQKRSVNIYYLYYVNTIEEIIDTRLRVKQQLSDDVIAITENEDMDDYLSALNTSPIKQ